MNILINAYRVGPKWGSESGMGWNWISNLSKYCNLYIITEGERRDEIEEALNTHLYKDHLHFYFLPVSDKVLKMCKNQGDWRFYYYYRQWQKRALSKAREICRETNIDIIHQLNMIGFREPGYLWKIDKPFVWGPIGGIGDNLPDRFLSDAPIRMRLFMYVKKMLNDFQFSFSIRVNNAIKHSDALIAAVPIVQEKIKNIKKRDCILIPETGCYDLHTEIIDKRQRKDFHIIWVAKFDFRKRLDIALNTISKIKDLPGLHFHICGTGNEMQIKHYKEMGKMLGIDNLCDWHGIVDNKKVHEMMKKSDLFFFTSISEATSTVIPEAINNCLPIVCFNTCGFGRLVTDSIGRKVKLTTPQQAINDFAYHIRMLYNDKELLYTMSLNCRKVLKTLLWEEKILKLIEIYKKII